MKKQFLPSILRRALCYLDEHHLQLAKFVLIGFVTFGINFFSFHLFYGLIGLDYRSAATLAYPITVISHFLLHRFYTFNAREQSLPRNFGMYVLMLALNYVIMMTVIWFVVDIVGLSPYLGVIASTATTACLNFVVMKHFVFNPKRIFCRS